ncbi:MAG: hypothetical protein GX663_02580 [Clostridiales bacterium]|nr:hypothetical protein [Clostridiales bacterium]
MVKAIAEVTKEVKDKDKINESIEDMVDIFVNRSDMIHYYNGGYVPVEQFERYHRIMGIIREECAGKISINQISVDYGFFDTKYICRSFKK